MPSERSFWDDRFAAIRVAIVWVAFASLRALVLLPFRWQLALAMRGGKLMRILLPSRRRIVEQNLRVCFPELSGTERARLTREHFAALGASCVELAMGWYGPLRTIERLVRIEGKLHLAAALEQGKGVILFSAHFTSFEFFFPVLAPLCGRLCGMYKTPRNPLMDKIMKQGRSRSFAHLFPKESVRDMLRELQRGSVVWYASDQSYGHKRSALVPFFDEPAMTNTSISRIAESTGAAVLPYFCRRLPGDAGYEAVIMPPLRDFPSDDAIADTARLTRLLEDYIRTCPEQYWWVHQRFKGRPAPYRDIYDPLASA